MKKIREMMKSRKGFTLVEIIVVLVILAILAAFTIPAMLGFVNDARSKAAVAQAREIYVAAQSNATEVAALNTGTGEKITTTNQNDIVTKTTKMVTADLPSLALSASIVTAVPTNADAKTALTKKDMAIIYVTKDGTVLGVGFADANGNKLLLTKDKGTEVL